MPGASYTIVDVTQMQVDHMETTSHPTDRPVGQVSGIDWDRRKKANRVVTVLVFGAFFASAAPALFYFLPTAWAIGVSATGATFAQAVAANYALSLR